MEENRYDEELIEHILDSAASIRLGEHHSGAFAWEIKNDEYANRSFVLLRGIHEMFENSDVTVTIKDVVTDVYDVAVVAEGKEVFFDDIPKFLYLASVADCVEIDTTQKETVRVSFYIINIANKIGEC